MTGEKNVAYGYRVEVLEVFACRVSWRRVVFELWGYFGSFIIRFIS